MDFDEPNSDALSKDSFAIFVAEGDVLFKQGTFRKALESYTAALEIEPSDQNCLVARSKCHLQLGDAKAALEDANASLVEDNKYIKGLLQKAEALYQMGDFESSLMYYHRGNKLRPELQDFRLGIQKAQEAIENSVGSPSVVKLEAVGDLSHFQKQDEGKTKKAPRLGYSKPAAKMHDDKKKRRAPRKEKSDKEKETTKQLLGELYADKEFLDKLLQDNDLTREGTDSGEHIYSLVNQGIDYLDTRTEFWRQQKPMYARKREKEVAKGRQDGKSKPSTPAKYVLKNLEEIDAALANGRPKDAMRQAQKVLKTVERWRDEDVADKQEFLSNLHSSMGNAQLDLGKVAQALEHHRIDLQISKENNFEDGRSRALDNLGRVYARNGKFQEAIQHWKEKLPLVKSTLEATWLYHEIGRCHLELADYSQARDFGEKSLKAAQEAGDDVWQLNASVLVAQSEVKLGDLQDAIESFERAHEMATVQGDEPAKRAISSALEELNQKIVQGIRDGDNRQAEEEEKEEEEKPAKDAEVAKEEAPTQPKAERREEQAEQVAEEAPPEEEYEEQFEDDDEQSAGRQSAPAEEVDTGVQEAAHQEEAEAEVVQEEVDAEQIAGEEVRSIASAEKPEELAEAGVDVPSQEGSVAEISQEQEATVEAVEEKSGPEVEEEVSGGDDGKTEGNVTTEQGDAKKERPSSASSSASSASIKSSKSSKSDKSDKSSKSAKSAKSDKSSKSNKSD